MKLLFLYLNTINEAYILIDKFYQKKYPIEGDYSKI